MRAETDFVAAKVESYAAGITAGIQTSAPNPPNTNSKRGVREFFAY
jgi:hypothetical protein